MTRLFDTLFARADEEILVWEGGEPWVHMQAVCRALEINYTTWWAQTNGRKALRFVDQPIAFKKLRLLGPSGRRRLVNCMHARDFLYWMLVYEPKPGKAAAYLRPLIGEFRREAMAVLWQERYGAAFKSIPLDGAPRVAGTPT